MDGQKDGWCFPFSNDNEKQKCGDALWEKQRQNHTFFIFFIEEALKKAETNDMASSKRQL